MADVQVSGGPVRGNMTVRLMVKFDPQELGREKTAQLMNGLIDAIAAVSTPEERAELRRKFEAEVLRLRGKKVA